MALSAKAKKLVSEFTGGEPKLGDIKRHGKEIKKDHDLAMELWSTTDFRLRLLSTLIFDKKLLTESVINDLAADMLGHDMDNHWRQRCGGKLQVVSIAFWPARDRSRSR